MVAGSWSTGESPARVRHVTRKPLCFPAHVNHLCKYMTNINSQYFSNGLKSLYAYFVGLQSCYGIVSMLPNCTYIYMTILKICHFGLGLINNLAKYYDVSGCIFRMGRVTRVGAGRGVFMPQCQTNYCTFLWCLIINSLNLK